MIITIVTDVLGESNNGTTITCKRLIEGMKKRGHTVRVVSPYKTDEDGYYTLPTYNLGKFLNAYVAKNGVSLAKGDKEVMRQALEGADIVHLITCFSAAMCALDMAREMGIPVTAGFHTQAENLTAHLFLRRCNLANKIFYRNRLNRIYRYVDEIHCPSKFIASVIRQNGYKVPISVISNGVSSEYAKKEVARPVEYEGKIIVLFIGRYSKEKRQDIVIDAIKKSKYKDKIQLILAGDGPLREKLMRRTESLPNKPVMKFFGNGTLVDVINYSDIYVHASDDEIEAIACLEAISCGLVPIISDSKNSATNDFALSDANLFKAGNPKSLAEKLDYFIEHPDEVNTLREQYENYSQQFALDSCLNKMEQMFESVLERRKKEK